MAPDKMHLAIIPDGNRRWAKRHGWKPWKGHEQALENFRSLTEWCRTDPRVGILTIWCFSTENWKRDPEEVQHLMELFEGYLRREQEDLLKKRTRLLHSGRKDRIPSSLAELLRDTEEKTKDFSEFTLHLALDYGGQDELLRAIKKLPAGQEVTDESLRMHLDQPGLPDIDFIIRTSGEQRASNFFLWQSTYAEWVFADKFFPEFSVDDLAAAVDAFSKRTRRFGS